MYQPVSAIVLNRVSVEEGVAPHRVVERHAEVGAAQVQRPGHHGDRQHDHLGIQQGRTHRHPPTGPGASPPCADRPTAASVRGRRDPTQRGRTSLRVASSGRGVPAPEGVPWRCRPTQTPGLVTGAAVACGQGSSGPLDAPHVESVPRKTTITAEAAEPFPVAPRSSSARSPTCRQGRVPHDRYIDVVEHIKDDRGEMRRAAEWLRPGGHLVVVCPAHQLLFSAFDRAPRPISAATTSPCSGARPTRPGAACSAPSTWIGGDAPLAGQEVRSRAAIRPWPIFGLGSVCDLDFAGGSIAALTAWHVGKTKSVCVRPRRIAGRGRARGRRRCPVLPTGACRADFGGSRWARD